MARPRFLIGASHKMYFSHSQAVAWSAAVRSACADHPAIRQGLVEFFTIPQFPSIPAIAALMAPWPVGAQDVAEEDAGPYTGEVSAAVLAEVGARLVEVGHAERLRLFGETPEQTARKVAAVLRAGLQPLICVGEHQRGSVEFAVADCKRQIDAALRQARQSAAGRRVILAYEPHWAIGAAIPASDSHIRAVSARLRAHLAADPDFDGLVIYGGSAGPGLLSRIADEVDGLFLGRFAHDPAVVPRILDEALGAATRSGRL